MSTTVTVRIDDDLRRALEAQARAQGKTLSAMVRATLEGAVAERPFASRAGHLRGRLRLASPIAGTWRAKLRERNWRK
jgi:predicted transcriptional regulator